MKILQNIFCKAGRAKLVINQGRTPAENETYWHLRARFDGTNGNAQDLLFTENEINNAVYRAKKNPEDCR